MLYSEYYAYIRVLGWATGYIEMDSNVMVVGYASNALLYRQVLWAENRVVIGTH